MEEEITNWEAFYDTLSRLGPQLVSGIPDELKEEWWMAVSIDEFFTPINNPLNTLDAFWNIDTPQEAVKEALNTWLENVKDSFISYFDTWWEEYGYNHKEIRIIADGIKLKYHQELFDQLVKAAYLPQNSISVEHLSFELLPSGDWDMDDVIKHFKQEKERLPDSFSKRAIQEYRLIEIKSLSPERCYVGNKQWLGYVVFEFLFTDKVILECPIEGNATYILSGDWKSMIQNSRQYLRNNFPDSYVKIVHRGDWFARVHKALQ